MKAFLLKLSQRNHWTANLTTAAKSSRFFVARGALHMVSFGQRFRVVEKSRFTTCPLLLAASILNRWEPKGECCMEMKNFAIKQVTIDDYDQLFELWNSTEQSRRAMNPVDDSREGIERYLKRNPNTCFAAVQDGRIIGVILTGHDGRRGIIHHMCVHPEYRRMGIAAHLVSLAEEALLRTTRPATCSGKSRAIPCGRT